MAWYCAGFATMKMANVARLRRAYALQKSGDRNDLLEAKTLLTEYLQLPPSVAFKDEAIYQLAWINHDLELPDDSQEKFQQLIDQYPDSKYWSDAVYRVAQRSSSSGTTGTGETLIAKLISRPDIPVEIYARVLYLQGELAAKEQRWEEVGSSMRKTVATAWLAEIESQSQLLVGRVTVSATTVSTGC